MRSSDHARPARPRPPVLRALGANDPPELIHVDGQRYKRAEVLKHDSWAATAVYAGSARRLICKFNRVQPIFAAGTAWIGNRLAARERSFLVKLADQPNVPNAAGPVTVDGAVWPHALAREYLAGHPLHKDERVADSFFPDLLALLHEMHRRGIAYVDLHKRENILVAADGRPYLIDFQISFDAAHPRVRWLPGVDVAFDYLCRSDLYHLWKHVSRNRPDQVAELFPHASADRPWWIRLHRTLAVPFRTFRRGLLKRAGVRGDTGRADTEHFPEDAVRREANRRAA